MVGWVGGVRCEMASKQKPPCFEKYQEDIVNKDRCPGKPHETEVIFFGSVFKPPRIPESPERRQQLFVGFEGFMLCEEAGRGLSLPVASLKAL